MKKFFEMQPSSLLKGTAMTLALAMAMTSCSNDDMPAAPGEVEEGTQTTVGTDVNVVNDPALLSQYVTNYKVAGSGALRLSRSAQEWSMPELPSTYDGMTVLEQDPYSSWVNYQNGTYVVAAGSELNYSTGGFGLNGTVDLYIFGKLTVPNINFTDGKYNIYLAPGGELVLTGNPWDTTTPSVLADHKPVTLYLYDGAKYTGALNSGRTTALYVEGDLTTGDVNFEGEVHIAGNLAADKLVTNNADFVAGNVVADTWTYNNESKVYVDNLIDIAGDVTINSQNVTIECQNYQVGGNFHMENNSELYAYEHIGVNGWMNVATQGIVYTPCLYVSEELKITNCATLNIPEYIYCNGLVADASGFAINMGKNALIYAGAYFNIENKNWKINFANDEETWAGIKADKFQIMEGKAGYITGYVVIDGQEFWGKPSENFQYYVEGDNYKEYEFQQTVALGDVNIKNAESCKPEIETPDTPDTPPTITEIVSSIDHTHDISATCITVNNGKAYLSWHKRGTSIHGCLEALQVIDDQASLTSWMEVNDDDVEGGNNWDGNSAVSGADINGETQGQFDFNHLIVAEGKVVTVGDNAKMGGFIGAIALDANGDFGTNGTLQDAFQSRQLLASVTDKVGRSGNAVLYANGKYYIACAGGFQEYNGNIDGLFEWIQYKNPQTDVLGYWANKLGDYELTDGSAKHIAINPAGNLVATLELTDRIGLGSDDYWFNDTETAIPAVLKVRKADNWLNSTVWEANIGDITPIYGKNAIAMDANGDVYVSAGKQGLVVYNNGNEVRRFSISDENPRAAVNGVAIDDQYVYVAYSVGGVYILNKSDLSIVSWYKSQRPDNYDSEVDVASANYITVDGDYIYVAYGRHGVKVLKLVK